MTPEELQEIQTEYRHARNTPRNGTDISSPARQQEILRCPNQAKCIVPELTLARQFKVYFCKNPKQTGLRFYFLAREGFLMHPGVTMVNSTAEADLLVLVSFSPGWDWSKTECGAQKDAKKLIILNEGDSVVSVACLFFSLVSFLAVLHPFIYCGVAALPFILPTGHPSIIPSFHPHVF